MRRGSQSFDSFLPGLVAMTVRPRSARNCTSVIILLAAIPRQRARVASRHTVGREKGMNQLAHRPANSEASREIGHKAFRDSFLYGPYKRVSFVGEYVWWRLRGSPRPKVPHLVKQHTLTQFAEQYNLRVLVETGTNLGHMIRAQKDRFREIYSIELDEWLAARARRKFGDRPNIHLYQGDSGELLPQIIPAIREPCLFWLDAHWGDISAPIKKELDSIFRHPVRDHVLLIDDARWFDGRSDYLTMDELRDRTAREFPGFVVEVKDDIIRIYRPKS